MNERVGNIISINTAKVDPDQGQLQLQMIILENHVEDAVQRVKQALQQGISHADVCELSELLACARQSVRKILHKKFLA
jgi:hypothetical protein